ncbi:hypothetical protein NFI96_002612 [Prochilodus magdalenae]|nr:hypothetical protein NFI96_002612 [Prochilodus magdalenae]
MHRNATFYRTNEHASVKPALICEKHKAPVADLPILVFCGKCQPSSTVLASEHRAHYRTSSPQATLMRPVSDCLVRHIHRCSRAQEDKCPGPRWNAMCRSCCEYERIVCICPSQRTKVGYAVPCCRNDIHQCDPCIIHQGCNVFDNCKRCNNGTWEAKDDFYVSGTYCTECRQGWAGGDCLTCGDVIRRPQGHVILESYPINAKCDWTLHVSKGMTMELRQVSSN